MPVKNPPSLPDSEEFLHATSLAARALSSDTEFRVRIQKAHPITAYTVANPRIELQEESEHLATLTMPDSVSTQKDQAYIRGATDFLALQKKYHSRALQHRLEQSTGEAQSILEKAEEARVEILGARAMAGVAANLSARLEREILPLSPEGLSLANAVALVIRDAFWPASLPPALKKLVTKEAKWIADSFGKAITTLEPTLVDQKQFSETLKKLLEKIGVLNFAKPKREQDVSMERQGTEDPIDDSEPLETQATATNSQDSKTPSEEKSQQQTVPQLSDSIEQIEDEEGEIVSERRQTPTVPTLNYQAFTTEFDEVVTPQEICTNEELHRLRSQLDNRLRDLKDITYHLAARLQHKLLSAVELAWEYQQEEGLLDTARLPRAIIDPYVTHIYKQHREVPHKSTVVSLLLDNSGSMRGRPIMLAALSADIIARTLERCQIKTEILGFTTVDWKGGKSRREWVKQGAPPNPGRLNDLRHILYKSADQHWRIARKNLGLMLREGLLKENIDGEALLWAHQRLAKRPERRKILMVISDGAPVDDSTLSANHGSYLDTHLRQVIRHIESLHQVELLAVGIGHDVTTHYSRAVTISDVAHLGDAMVDQLVELFTLRR